MNPLLIGKAEVLSQIREDIQRMVDNPGVWIVTDEKQPGAEVPVISVDGKLYAIELSTELAPDRFLPTVRVASGPHRAYFPSGTELDDALRILITISEQYNFFCDVMLTRPKRRSEIDAGRRFMDALENLRDELIKGRGKPSAGIAGNG